MTRGEIKLYYDYDSEELINVLYDEEVYYVFNIVERTEEYIKYEIDQNQNATRHYSECTESSVLIDFNDKRNSCILDGVLLNVINR